MKIVPLRETPPLTDIVGHLRRLAQGIEDGVYGDVTTTFVLITRPDDFPIIMGLGDVEGPNHPVIQLELAKHWFVANLTNRT